MTFSIRKEVKVLGGYSPSGSGPDRFPPRNMNKVAPSMNRVSKEYTLTKDLPKNRIVVDVCKVCNVPTIHPVLLGLKMVSGTFPRQHSFCPVVRFLVREGRVGLGRYSFRHPSRQNPLLISARKRRRSGRTGAFACFRDLVDNEPHQ